MAHGQWTLGIRAVVGVVTIAAAAISLGLGLVVFVAAVLPPSFFQAEEVRPWVIAACCLRLFNIIQASLGMAGYILVSYGISRPLQLHLCMLVVLLVLPGQCLAIGGSVLRFSSLRVVLWLVRALLYITWAIRKTILYLVVRQKLAVFPSSGCTRASSWANVMILSHILSVLAGVGVWIFCIVIRMHGHPLAAPWSIAFERSGEFPTADVMLMRVLFFIMNLGVLCYSLAGVVMLVLARHLVQSTVKKLTGRGVAAGMLEKVRHTLRSHLLGMVASIGTGYFSLVKNLINISDILGSDVAEDVVSALVSIIDIGGDVAGLFLLSGINELLFRGDCDIGDFNHHIRSLFRSTVLTSRAETVFEGSVLKTPKNMCIASFPGKFIEDWNELTWLCEQRELSSACVFLPTSDPGKRFGEHAQCPEDPGKRCWCYSLYGEEKPWGCSWFATWRDNIEKAVGLGLDLVVVFFPGQAGKGLVDWPLLPTADLWDGVGLGGSQKAEAAFLRKNGFDFIELDLEEARRLCLGRSHRMQRPPAPAPPATPPAAPPHAAEPPPPGRREGPPPGAGSLLAKLSHGHWRGRS